MRIYRTIIPGLFLLYSFMITCTATGQLKETGKKKRPRGKASVIAVGINVPLGDFFHTHILGSGAEYSGCNHRLGNMITKPSSPFGFIYAGGIDYYYGKKEMNSVYTYHYPGFTLVHTYGGVIYNPCKNANISLTAGPAPGLYNGLLKFWWGVNLSGQYYFNEKFGIATGLIYMKKGGAEAIWSGTLRVVMAF